MLAQIDSPALPPSSPIYRQFFTPEEIRQLDQSPLESAVGEIALLRILITRLLQAPSRGAGSSRHHGSLSQTLLPFAGAHESRGKRARLTPATRLSLLLALCQAVTTIASLARHEFKHREPGPSPLELYMDAMNEIDPLL